MKNNGDTIIIFDFEKHKQSLASSATVTMPIYVKSSSMGTHAASPGAAWEQSQNSGGTIASNSYVNRVVDLAKTTGRFVRDNRETIASIAEIVSKFYK